MRCGTLGQRHISDDIDRKPLVVTEIVQDPDKNLSFFGRQAWRPWISLELGFSDGDFPPEFCFIVSVEYPMTGSG